MADDVSVNINADPSGLQRGFKAAVGTVNTLSSAVEKARGTYERFHQTVQGMINKVSTGMAATGAAIGVGLVAGTKSAATFESQMRNVNTITKVSDDQLQGMGSTILKLSGTLPKSSADLAEGLYNVASSGFAAADATKVLDAGAKAASAGLTSTNTAAGAIAGTLNAYSMGADKAKQVSDTLFQAVNYGVFTFDQLATGMGEWIGIAASAHVPLEDAASALATMTANGVQADQANVSLNRTIQSILQPTVALDTVIKGLGYSSGALMLQELGLHGTISALSGVIGDNTTQWGDLFDNVNALQGVLALTSGNGAKYNQIFDKMGTAQKNAGATAAALAQQSKSLSFQLSVLRNNVQNIGIMFGTTFLLPLRLAAQAMNFMFGAARQLPGPLVAIISTFGGLLAIGLPLVALWVRFQLYSTLATAALGKLGEKLGVTIPNFVTLQGRLVQMVMWLLRVTGVTDRFKITAGQVGSVLGAIGIGALAATAILGLYNKAVSDAHQHSQEFINELQKGHDLSSRSGLEAYQQDLEASAMQADANKEAQGGWRNAIWGTVQTLSWMGNSIEEARNRAKDLNAEGDKTAKMLLNWSNNVHAVMDATGLTRPQVEALAKAMGVDLTVGGDSAREALIKAAQGGDAATLSFDSTTAAAKQTNEELQNMKSALQGFTDPSAILSDVTSKLKDTGGSGDVAAAGIRKVAEASLSLREAQSGLSDAQDKYNEARSHNYQLDNEIAQLNVAQAQDRLSDATDKLARVRAKDYSTELAQYQLERERAQLNQIKSADDLAKAIEHLNDVRAAGASRRDVHEAELGVMEARIGVADASNQAADASQNYNNALSGKTRAKELHDAEMEYKSALQEVQKAQSDLAATDPLKAQAKALNDASLELDRASIGLQKAKDELSQAKAGDVDPQASLGDFTKGVEESNVKLLQWQTDLVTISRRGAPREVVDAFVKMGQEGAGILHQFAMAGESEFSRLSQAMAFQAKAGTDEAARQMTIGMLSVQVAAGLGANATVEAIKSQLSQIAPTLMAMGPDIINAAKTWGFTVAVTPTAAPPLPNGQVPTWQARDQDINNPTWIPSAPPGGPGTQGPWGGGRANIPVQRAMGGIDRGGIAGRPTYVYGEGGSTESWIPWNGSARSHSIFQTTARAMGYAVGRLAEGGIMGSKFQNLPAWDKQTVRVIHVPVPEKMVALQEIEIKGVDLDSALRYAKQKARKAALVRPGASD